MYEIYTKSYSEKYPCTKYIQNRTAKNIHVLKIYKILRRRCGRWATNMGKNKGSRVCLSGTRKETYTFFTKSGIPVPKTYFHLRDVSYSQCSITKKIIIRVSIIQSRGSTFLPYTFIYFFYADIFQVRQFLTISWVVLFAVTFYIVHLRLYSFSYYFLLWWVSYFLSKVVAHKYRRTIFEVFLHRYFSSHSVLWVILFGITFKIVHL